MGKAKKIIFIVGPTAVGKSCVAFALAKRIQGEIISCDSMQVYQEITIASNKPSQAEFDEIDHHLLNCVSISEDFDVAQYARLAQEAIVKVHAKGHVPIIVGGSGMYMQVLLDGIFDGHAKNNTLREELYSQAQEHGKEFLHDQLKQADPVAAQKIHVHDLKRIVRALEVYKTEYQAISQLQKKREGLGGKYDIRIFGLNQQRDRLYEQINTRVDKMFEQGIVEEVRSLNGTTLTPSVKKMIGIKEVLGFLQQEYDVNHARDLMKLNTRHFAKRQLTWFRREKRIRWILTTDKEDHNIIVEKILKIL